MDLIKEYNKYIKFMNDKFKNTYHSTNVTSKASTSTSHLIASLSFVKSTCNFITLYCTNW